MKIRLLALPLIAAIALSCGKESVESRENGTKTHIAFTTQLSRGSAISNAQDLALSGGFNVWAYSHSGKWASNPSKTALLSAATVISSNGTSWISSPAAEWPDDYSYVSFFAYGPAASATPAGTNASGVPVISFTANADPVQQKDLLIATPVYDQFGPDYSDNHPVGLFFNHALSMVHFSGVLEGTMTDQVKVKKVVLSNVYYQGMAALQTPVSWNAATSSKATYSVSAGNGLEDIALTTTPQELSTANGLMFLIPQTVNRAADQMELTVTLSVAGADMIHTIPVFSPEVWTPGRAYNYQISVEPGSIKVIVIDSDITLVPMTRNATTQSITLTDNAANDLENYYTGLTIANTLNSNGMVSGSNYFGIYGTYDLKHDITIDLNAVDLSSFTTNPVQYLIFDFKKTLGAWGADGTGKTWRVKIINYQDKWELMPSYQPTPTPDASTGATTQTPADSLRNRGTIYIRRK